MTTIAIVQTAAMNLVDSILLPNRTLLTRRSQVLVLVQTRSSIVGMKATLVHLSQVRE